MLLVVVFLCVRRLVGSGHRLDLLTVLPAGVVVCLAVVPLCVLPIAHLPSIASVLLLIAFVPTRLRQLVAFPLWGWVLAGLLIGVSTLFRANLVLELPVLAAALGAAVVLARAPVRKAVTPVVVCTLATALVIAPWTLRNWYVLHRFVAISTNGGCVFYSGNGSPNPREQGAYNSSLYEELYRHSDDEIERDRAGWRMGLANIRAHPDAFMISFVYRVPRLLGPQTFPAEYVQRQGRGSETLLGALVVGKLAWVTLFWGVWVATWSARRAVAGRVWDQGRVPWPELSLAVAVAASLMFEISPTYQLSLYPFVLGIWLGTRNPAVVGSGARSPNTTAAPAPPVGHPLPSQTPS